MVAHWQSVGFCHGVMNTDNMSILGLSLDYGPFQMMDTYNPKHICNHTDSGGRYAFDRQPHCAHWNLFCLGQALLPLIEDQELALAALAAFNTEFAQTFHALMCNKLGLLPNDSANASPEATALIADILALLAQQQADYTIFWRRLSHARAHENMDPVRDLFADRANFEVWLLRYLEHIKLMDTAQSANLMLKSNPKYILRNHLAELAIEAAKVKDFSYINRLLTVLERPFDEHPDFESYADFAPAWASQIEISCSS
jgi:uncharacterized protein YdiU (UPF0061 family)